MELRILDCTLRDGGYYNDWDFSFGLASRYLDAMQASGVDIVELGFRGPLQERFLGPFAFTSDALIESLDVPDGLVLGVMINAKDLLADDDPATAVDRYFNPANKSPVSLVRIAAHFGEFEKCEPAVRRLAELGYTVGINIMQAGGRGRDAMLAKAEAARGWPLAVLYFADSLGNMDATEVADTVSAFRQGWQGEVGFHAHENMGRGMENAMAAINAGATWIDGTVTGMGRGAGNVRTEYLLLEMMRRDLRSPDMDKLFQLVIGDFGALQRQYNWGPNLFYYLSGLYGVHPTYVQEMLSDSRYQHEQVLDALGALRGEGSAGFSRERLRQAAGGELLTSAGAWDASGWAAGRDVLIVGPGEQGELHAPAVHRYIRARKPVVLCLNSNTWLDPDLVTAWVAGQGVRLLMDQDYYAGLKGRIICPAGGLSADLKRGLKGFELLDYGLAVEPGRFEVASDCCVIPQPLSALYALAVAAAADARQVYVAGFDGFSEGDPRYREMQEALAVYHESPSATAITAITPSRYPFAAGSVYALEAGLEE